MMGPTSTVYERFGKEEILQVSLFSINFAHFFCGQKADKTTYIMSDINLIVGYSGVFQCSGYHQNIARVPNSDANSDMVPKTL